MQFLQNAPLGLAGRRRNYFKPFEAPTPPHSDHTGCAATKVRINNQRLFPGKIFNVILGFWPALRPLMMHVLVARLADNAVAHWFATHTVVFDKPQDWLPADVYTHTS